MHVCQLQNKVCSQSAKLSPTASKRTRTGTFKAVLCDHMEACPYMVMYTCPSCLGESCHRCGALGLPIEA